MRKHLRLLPVVLFAGALILTVKVGGLWSNMSVSAGAASSAEEKAAAEAVPAATGAEPAAVEETPPELAAPSEAPEPAAAQTESLETAVAAASEAAATVAETAPETAAADSAAAADPFDFTDEEIDVLQSLAKRREQLDAQERVLQQREALLSAAEQRMDQKLAELKTLQETISGQMKQHDEQAQAQLLSLVKIYENMKPKDAGRIFEQLEMDVLLDVVAGMKEQKVAAILAEVDPGRAKDITLELSERRSLPIATE